MKRIAYFFLVVALVSFAGTLTPANAADIRPNIIWIVVEDMSAHFGCYGESTIATPNVDRLAREGVRFANASVTCPVCSPSRSALITGMYQTSIGAHNHRSGRGEIKIHLPDGVRTLPEIFRAAGYSVTNGSLPNRKGRIAKTDYNFEKAPEDIYDGADWTEQSAGKPFFAQYQLAGGKNRNVEKARQIADSLIVKPEDVTLPPYYPDDPVIRQDWADYLNAVLFVDKQVGEILDLLEEHGLSDNTYVFFLTDHGISHARGKQFLYEEGIRVPLIIRGPDIDPGQVREDLVAHIDMAPASLQFAGIEIPEWMTDSRPLFDPASPPRDYVVSARDRCDETVDHLRGVRTAGFKYIRNYLPERPHLQPNAYKDGKEVLQRLRQLHAEGKNPPLVETLLFAPTRPKEELYDLEKDPWELNNLADDPAYADTLSQHQDMLADWITNTGDLGQTSESEALYDSDMQVYLDTLKVRNPERLEIIQRNIATHKAWLKEGK